MISYIYESYYNQPCWLTKDFTINYKIHLYKILVSHGAGDLYAGVEFVGADAGAYAFLPVSHDCKVAINENTFNHL